MLHQVNALSHTVILTKKLLTRITLLWLHSLFISTYASKIKNSRKVRHYLILGCNQPDEDNSSLRVPTLLEKLEKPSPRCVAFQFILKDTLLNCLNFIRNRILSARLSEL